MGAVTTGPGVPNAPAHGRVDWCTCAMGIVVMLVLQAVILLVVGLLVAAPGG